MSIASEASEMAKRMIRKRWHVTHVDKNNILLGNDLNQEKIRFFSFNASHHCFVFINALFVYSNILWTIDS
ncbi:hypothetical protein Syun_001725 [Stephania yunnanensis]|uniref:Uncharacterized protein n=1 Tax=Stephania yunnanensis TaxID=152371 RepID=A0AAP0Q6Q5_9MAGN